MISGGVAAVPPTLIDTHAHLDQEEFDADREDVVARARRAGVVTIVAVGTTIESSGRCVRMASSLQGVQASVGIQPNYVAESDKSDWHKIEKLSREPRVVAIGETGLDRYWDFTPFALQQDFFDRHMRLAQARDLPFIVHMRDCQQDILSMLREAHTRGPLRGVMHSFTGDPDMAAECLAMGLHISFAGMVTFKKSNDLRSCARAIPHDRMLIETDSPYLSPEPVRKVRRNEPAHLTHTAACVAEQRGMTLAEFAALTTDNARRLFGNTEC